ncbi:hypothetical protein CaLGV082 [Clostera anastomosis granulovirus A]|uniref:Uncharacterized protein n=1 Tax=Clostera anastomosis granulovirus A TaxID=1986289 RepID=U5KBA7_9BBAC|nr:hypothetical protein CaLGV082 [Clostera anastomosis granulovirus Henan]AGQ20340.1 hypothetical protein CaLGV082 [Clostera anastomosis granulovirus Henan]
MTNVQPRVRLVVDVTSNDGSIYNYAMIVSNHECGVLVPSKYYGQLLSFELFIDPANPPTLVLASPERGFLISEVKRVGNRYKFDVVVNRVAKRRDVEGEFTIAFVSERARLQGDVKTSLGHLDVDTFEVYSHVTRTLRLNKYAVHNLIESHVSNHDKNDKGDKCKEVVQILLAQIREMDEKVATFVRLCPELQ